MTDEQDSRRELLKKAAYVAPTILTLKVAPAFAQSGSGQQGASGQQGSTGQGSGQQGQQGFRLVEKNKERGKREDKEKDKRDKEMDKREKEKHNEKD